MRSLQEINCIFLIKTHDSNFLKDFRTMTPLLLKEILLVYFSSGNKQFENPSGNKSLYSFTKTHDIGCCTSGGVASATTATATTTAAASATTAVPAVLQVPTTQVIQLNFYRPQRSCGQGNTFTLVCHSVHKGGCRSTCWDTNPPGTRPPPRTRPPRDQTPPQSRHPPRDQTPPRKLTPAYGLRAAGTHPTGMHSC